MGGVALGALNTASFTGRGCWDLGDAIGGVGAVGGGMGGNACGISTVSATLIAAGEIARCIGEADLYDGEAVAGAGD